jgi:hypothetical protein
MPEFGVANRGAFRRVMFMDSRIEILRGVKRQVSIGTGEPAEQAWTSEQHWQAFSFLFMDQGMGSDHQLHDDLLFFVHGVRQPRTPQVSVRFTPP